MKQIFLFLFFLLSTGSAFSDSISTYQELAAEMRAGNQFVIVTDFQECTGQNNMPIGYFIPHEILLVPASVNSQERIVTSSLHFSDYTGIPTYEYTKYTFNSDNSVVIRTITYDAATCQPVGSEHSIHGSIDHGVYIYSSEKPPLTENLF